MADEITVSASLEFTKGGNSASASYTAISLDMTGTKYTKKLLDVDAAEEALPLDDASTGGYCILKNTHATATVSVRQATGASDLIDIGPGEIALFRLSTDAAAPYVISDTANTEVEYLLLEA